jgi:hypothetical protein
MVDTPGQVDRDSSTARTPVADGFSNFPQPDSGKHALYSAATVSTHTNGSHNSEAARTDGVHRVDVKLFKAAKDPHQPSSPLPGNDQRESYLFLMVDKSCNGNEFLVAERASGTHYANNPVHFADDEDDVRNVAPRQRTSLSCQDAKVSEAALTDAYDDKDSLVDSQASPLSPPPFVPGVSHLAMMTRWHAVGIGAHSMQQGQAPTGNGGGDGGGDDGNGSSDDGGSNCSSHAGRDGNDGNDGGRCGNRWESF